MCGRSSAGSRSSGEVSDRPRCQATETNGGEQDEVDEREDRRDRPDEDEENDPQRDAGEAPPRQEVCPGHGGGEHDGPDPDTEQLQGDLFAKFEVTEQVDLKRLQTLLRDVRGPSQLADNPSAYAW